MFTDTIKTPFDFYNGVTEYFNKFPKNEKEIKEVLEKVKKVFQDEVSRTSTMWKTYNKAAKGDATLNEISTANKIAYELLVSTRFALFLTIPGSVFLLPALVKFAEEYDIDLIPLSVKKEFDI